MGEKKLFFVGVILIVPVFAILFYLQDRRWRKKIQTELEKIFDQPKESQKEEPAD